jgi:hypothetical protein
MQDSTRPDLAPQGDQFTDQYTSATADLSAGGVATARESAQEELEPTPETAAVSQPHITSTAMPAPSATQNATRPSPIPFVRSEILPVPTPRTIGLGAGAALSIGSAAAGAWLYSRWQRERKRPINRLRRGAKDVASRIGEIGERLPDTDAVPEAAAPMSSAAAVLVGLLLLTRALRQRMQPAVPAPAERTIRPPRARVMVGVGGVSGVAVALTAGYLIWRLVRGGGTTNQQSWSIGESSIGRGG